MSLYQLLQDKRSGSSGMGGSFYSTAANCGMLARLREVYRYEERESDGTDLTATGRRKVDAKRAGTFFHALQEMWRRNEIPADMIVAADHADYDYEIALNSFNKYRAAWADNRHNLGEVRSAEVRLPEIDPDGQLTALGKEQHGRIMEFTGGIAFTMRYDLLTEIRLADIARIAIERELALPTEGTYIIDYKLVGQINSNTMWQYSYDFQQLAYPIIYNLCYPDAPVQGMLTEVMARVVKPEPRHYALYLAYADERSSAIVKHGIRRGSASYNAGEANPFSCMGKYGACWFLVNGVCPRYGQFSDFVFDKTGAPSA